MDNFREWLSDNLRYFMLGGAVLIVVLVLFFGVRACVGGKDKTPEPQQSVGTDSNTVSPTPAEASNEENDNPLVEGSTEIVELTKQYYEALGNKDVETLETFVENLSPSEEAKITNARYIEGYEVGDVYTKKGLTDGSYVVFASYTYRCTGIETPAPGLSWLYVYPDSEGNLKINGSALEDSEISAYAETLRKDQDVSDLESKVNTELENAKESDPALAEFLTGLGEDADGSASEEEGTTMTTNDDANVRASADGESDIINVLPVGTEVKKLGEEGEWIQIEYDGQTGYIYNTLLD